MGQRTTTSGSVVDLSPDVNSAPKYHTQASSYSGSIQPIPQYLPHPQRSISSPAVTVAYSTSPKRVQAYPKMIDDNCQERVQLKRKMAEAVVTQEKRITSFLLCVCSHACLGTLFASGSVCGRGTTVFSVVPSGEKRRLALKMSWQDPKRVAYQDVVMAKLKKNPHPNVIVPLEMFNAVKKGRLCTTLGTIRAFLDEQINHVPVKNRVFNISVSALKRPVKYFWGVHDFVQGLRGALLGHQFLTSVGILHRDISENNIVLGIYPWEERGYLIDFDMATLYAEESSKSSDEGSKPAAEAERKKDVKELQTGTLPYMSICVLMKKRHTHFDDVESFLYVLLLFFFSYAGPLPKTELEAAHRNGFTRPIGSGRLSHMRNWPAEFAHYRAGDVHAIALKFARIYHPAGATNLVESAEVKDCLQKNWPEVLHDPIRSLLKTTFEAFRKTTKERAHPTELSHSEFIEVLDEWLVKYSELEQECSNCPDFKDSRVHNKKVMVHT